MLLTLTVLSLCRSILESLEWKLRFSVEWNGSHNKTLLHDYLAISQYLSTEIKCVLNMKYLLAITLTCDSCLDPLNEFRWPFNVDGHCSQIPFTKLWIKKKKFICFPLLKKDSASLLMFTVQQVTLPRHTSRHRRFTQIDQLSSNQSNVWSIQHGRGDI